MTLVLAAYCFGRDMLEWIEYYELLIEVKICVE